MNNFYKYLLAGCAVLILSACTKAPTCADEENFNLIKQIYQKKFDENNPNLPERVRNILNARFKDYPLTIESIMDDGRNSETGRQTCSASLVIALPTKLMESTPELMNNRTLIWLGLNQKHRVEIDGNRFKMHVNYVLQRTADTKALTISIEDLYPFVNLITDFAGTSLYTLQEQERAIVASLVPPSAGEIALMQSAPEMPSIAQLVGKQPADALGDKFVESKLKAFLTSNYAKFAENLAVASALQEEGDFVYGSGNAVQGGGSDEAGLAIHKKSGAVYAVMLVDGKDVKWFGAESSKDLPAPLRKWLANKGVSN
jgi:hypothetical protein